VGERLPVNGRGSFNGGIAGEHYEKIIDLLLKIREAEI
jgi:hypothetical protein